MDNSLTLNDVPAETADRHEIVMFAVSFNGYDYCGSLSACAKLAESGDFKTINDVRAALFFEQRSNRFNIPAMQPVLANGELGELIVELGDDSEAAMRRYVAEIRRRLTVGSA